MKTKLVEIVAHDAGWKGTWYTPGQRHFVRQERDWPKVIANRWSALDVSGGIHEHHARVLHGPIVWLRCLMRACYRSDVERTRARVATAMRRIASERAKEQAPGGDGDA